MPNASTVPTIAAAIAAVTRDMSPSPLASFPMRDRLATTGIECQWPFGRAAAPALTRHRNSLWLSDGARHRGRGVAVDVFEVLVAGVEHRHLVVERQVLELVDVAHERDEELQGRRVRLAPVLQVGERVPQADAEALLLRLAVL